jgi:hypothetical protein
MTTVFSPHDIHTTERRAPTRDLQEEFDDEVSYDDEMPPPAPLNSDDESDGISNTKDDTFDTLDEFGEDTLHILRDADLRLGCVPPLSSLKLNEDDLDEEASTEETFAESSLLRGPLMAAKSLACLQNATTPSTARAAFMTSSRKSEKEEATPSTAKSTLHSVKPTREQITPSNFIISTQKPPLSQNRDGNTPSAMRHRFIPSPQDSVSTMGSGGSGIPLHHHGVTPSAVRRGFMDTPKEEGVFTFDCVKDPNDNVNNIDKAIANGPNKSQNNTPQSSDKLPKSKPYLKRGTRKEPSSLHTYTPTTESSDERKSRLDKLEKMQEQLRLDYERREARKREAQRERRLNSRGSHGIVKSASVKEKLVESTTKALESVAVVGRGSVSTVRDASLKVACETLNNGILKQKDVPTPSQVRCSSPAVEEMNQVANMEEVASIMKKEEQSNAASKSRSQSKKTRPRSVSRSKMPTKPTSNSLKSSRVEDNEKPRSVSRPKTATKHMSSSLSPKRSVVNDTNEKAARSMSRPKTATIPNSSPKRSTAKDTDKAFEDWKKKESEEWAIIKNMRRRQEVALREAEGERERVCHSFCLVLLFVVCLEKEYD